MDETSYFKIPWVMVDGGQIYCNCNATLYMVCASAPIFKQIYKISPNESTKSNTADQSHAW